MRQLTLALAVAMLTCSNPGVDPNDPNNPNNPNDPNNPNNPGDPVASLDAELKNGTRLKNKYINGADGTVALAGPLFDTQLAVDCTFMPAEDGMMRCLPAGAYLYATLFLDSGCTQPLAYSAKCGPLYKYALDTSNASCAAQNRIFSIAEVTNPPAMIYAKSGPNCVSTPNSISSSYRLYVAGSAVAPSQFVAGTVVN